MTERVIKQVHFQITRNCNLRCAFCGQWGKKGFFADAYGTEMSLDDWKRVADELAEYKEHHGGNITVTVWGGEPLVSPYFDEIMRFLKYRGFETEIVTNGVLMNRHADVLREYTDRIYLSLDGTKEVHNNIRGNGVFEKVTQNLIDLKHKNVTVMSVLTPRLVSTLDEFLSELDGFGIKQLYLHDMIGLSDSEAVEYKKWIKECFDVAAHDIDAWINNDLFKADNIETGNHNYAIEHKIHTHDGYCKSPFHHVHIAWNGNVLYCTDFYDFSAGNVKEEKLEDIFLNEKSERFCREIQNGSCITCGHCSWKSREF